IKIPDIASYIEARSQAFELRNLHWGETGLDAECCSNAALEGSSGTCDWLKYDSGLIPFHTGPSPYGDGEFWECNESVGGADIKHGSYSHNFSYFSINCDIDSVEDQLWPEGGVELLRPIQSVLGSLSIADQSRSGHAAALR